VPWVVWYRAQSNGERLWHSHWGDGDWTTPEILRADAGRYDDYDLCAATSDDVWMATDTYVSGIDRRVMLVYHWDGSSWSEPWQLSLPEHGCYFPDFALDPASDPWLTWTGVTTESALQPVVCSRWIGDAWSEPDTVNGDLHNSVQSQIVFDGDTPMVLWNGDLAANVDIEYSRFENGVWTPAALVNLPDSTSADRDYLGTCESGSSGEIAVVWSAGNVNHVFSWDIRVSWWTGSGWTPERELSEDLPQKIDTNPDMALADDGALWSAWVCYEEIAYPWDQDIRATSCVLTTPVDFGPLSVELSGSDASISWYAAGDAAGGPFFVGRATTRDPATLPMSPPDSAAQLNSDGIVTAPLEWQDEDLPDGTLTLYWVEWRRPHGSVFIGPVLVATDSAVSDLPARLLSTTPNPTRVGASFHIKQFSPGSAELVLYTVGGRELRRLRTPLRQASRAQPLDVHLYWDGTDTSGTRVASGVYVAQLLLNGEAVVGQRGGVTLVR